MYGSFLQFKTSIVFLVGLDKFRGMGVTQITLDLTYFLQYFTYNWILLYFRMTTQITIIDLNCPNSHTFIILGYKSTRKTNN